LFSYFPDRFYIFTVCLCLFRGKNAKRITSFTNFQIKDLAMQPDVWSLYESMLRSRSFEEAVTQLWKEGFISGEIHLGTGEEAIVAGILAHLQDGDAMALDHRGTPPLIMRGVDPGLTTRELLGHQDGLCGGQGGHMHRFSKEHLAASSGIVGASGPTAAGFGFAAQTTIPYARHLEDETLPNIARIRAATDKLIAK
jgi:TPP-dependent pyruvate/acetoin dehydrogenase alpha subunit